jgi:hypothetical protein
VIAGAVSGSANQPKNDAESNRWLKSGTKSGIFAGGVQEGSSGVEMAIWNKNRPHLHAVTESILGLEWRAMMLSDNKHAQRKFLGALWGPHFNVACVMC